jgi:2-oxoglutarate ferredoxin oxidoreductase subunit gamma
MDKRTEIRLAGEGGQGMILAGIILAEAAAIYDGKQAVQTQSYGPEARGGASRSEVIISEGEIDHPEVLSADIVIALSRQAYKKFAQTVKAVSRFRSRASRMRQPVRRSRRTQLRSVCW